MRDGAARGGGDRPESGPPRPVRVLVVDDDRDFAESLVDIIVGRGYAAEAAFSGEEAVSRFASGHFDVVFMDVRLPGRDGVESLLEIRHCCPWARVVMMTGYSAGQLLDRAASGGARAVLHKPVSPRAIIDILAEIKPDRILVVDDDPDFCATLAEALAGAGFRPVVASGGEEALSMARAEGVDAAVLDVRMPGLDGFETHLELTRAGVNVPTVFVTAYAEDDPGVVDRARGVGALSVLSKPFDPARLIGELARMEKA
jgi:two-component system, NtrC family, response regulator HydG